MRRILAWQGTAGGLERPQLVERTGTVTGTLTTNGVVKDISHTMQLNGR